MKNLRIVVFSLFGALVIVAVASRGGNYHRSMTPRILSDWVESEDGRVSVCLAVDKTTFTPSETITVRCAIRNNTDDSLTMLRPFGDPFYAHSSGLRILGPKGAIAYRGPMKDYVLGTDAFRELRGQTVIDERLELPKDHLSGLGVPGLYRIQYTYQSAGYPKKPKPGNLWEGAVVTGAAHILVMDKTPNN
jgi:hypothetical protein